VAGKNAQVAADPISFKRVNSHRVRLNAELAHHYSDSLSLLMGAGYEYEFDGKARASTYEIYDINSPNVTGGTGMLTLGTRIPLQQTVSFPWTSRLMVMQVSAKVLGAVCGLNIGSRKT
jgi:hypothetical protein